MANTPPVTLASSLIAFAQEMGLNKKAMLAMIGLLSALPTTNKTSLAAAISETFGIATAADAKIGNLMALTSTNKTSLVAAYNELRSAVSSLDLSAIIDDNALPGDTDVSYSADKILTLLTAMETRIMGGVSPEERDTIKELGDYMVDNTVAGGVVQQMANRVRVDSVQAFSAEQQAQGRANLGAASKVVLEEFKGAIGDTTISLLDAYNAAAA